MCGDFYGVVDNPPRAMTVIACRFSQSWSHIQAVLADIRSVTGRLGRDCSHSMQSVGSRGDGRYLIWTLMASNNP